jgi:hypothetical protein
MARRGTYQFGKDCFGLDQYQARLYTAILRHAVLVMAAMAICAVTAALLKDRTDTQAAPPVTPDPVTPARTRRSLAELAVPPPGPLTVVLLARTASTGR